MMIKALLSSFFFIQITCLQASLVISEAPSCIIEGEESKLRQPEGVTFSPDGSFLAVVSSLGNSVSIYKRNSST